MSTKEMVAYVELKERCDRAEAANQTLVDDMLASRRERDEAMALVRGMSKCVGLCERCKQEARRLLGKKAKEPPHD